MKTIFKNKLLISLLALLMTVCAMLGIIATSPRSAKADAYENGWGYWCLMKFEDWEEDNYSGQTAINRWFKVNLKDAVDTEHASVCECAGAEVGYKFSIQLTNYTKLVVEICNAAPMRYSLESDVSLTAITLPDENSDLKAGFEENISEDSVLFAFKVLPISFEEPDGTIFSTETHALNIASAVSSTGTALELVEIIDPDAEPIEDVYPEEGTGTPDVNDDVPSEPSILDNVGDWIKEKADGFADWLGTSAGITISGTSIIVIVVGVILLRALLKKRK